MQSKCYYPVNRNGLEKLMIQRIATRFTEYIIQKEWIEPAEAIVYRTGIDVLLNFLIEALLIFSLGVLVRDILLALLFLLCFATVREYSGGYHASGRLRCYGVMVVTFLSVYILAWGITADVRIQRFFMVLCPIFIIVVFMKEVPAGNTAKKISEEEWKIFRKKAITAMLLWEIGATVIYFWQAIRSVQIICIELAIAILIIIEKLRRNKNGSK